MQQFFIMDMLGAQTVNWSMMEIYGEKSDIFLFFFFSMLI